MVFSAIKEAWNFVDKRIKKLFGLLLLVRLLTNIFDLVGTALMAILVGYVVGVLGGNPQVNSISPVINLFNLENFLIRNQVIALGDNDEAGRNMSKKMIEFFGSGCIAPELPEGIKDVSDLSDNDLKSFVDKFDNVLYSMLN